MSLALSPPQALAVLGKNAGLLRGACALERGGGTAGADAAVDARVRAFVAGSASSDASAASVASDAGALLDALASISPLHARIVSSERANVAKAPSR